MNIQASSKEFLNKAHPKKTRKLLKYFLVFSCSCTFGFLSWIVSILGDPEYSLDGETDKYSDSNVLMAYMKRTYDQLKHLQILLSEPFSNTLLPDPLQEPYLQPHYTLVIEIKDVLVHPEWSYSTGWRFKKRPFVQDFLQLVSSPLFEVVIFTSENGQIASPVLDILDPNGYIMFKLYRNATRYFNGHHVKDLSCINRDPNKVIYLDWDARSSQLQPRNSFPLKRWTGESEDSVLLTLADFLQSIAENKVEDVREVLDYYRKFDDPLEVFKEGQTKLQEIDMNIKEEEPTESSWLDKYWKSLFK